MHCPNHVPVFGVLLLLVQPALGGGPGGGPGRPDTPIVVDGSMDGAYGEALVVQDCQTGFGNSDLGWIDWANGSELDIGAAAVQGEMLFIMLGGNLESNWNKLEVFIDCHDGGQNTLRGDNPDVSWNGLNRMGDDGSGNGLTFDAGFDADYYFTLNCGDGGGFQTYADMAELLTDGGGSGWFVGGPGGAGADGVLYGGSGELVGIDNMNVAGVDGGDGPGDGSGVTTGIEIGLPLALIGAPVGDISICAFINGSNHDYLSNQVLGGLGGGGNLGDPRYVSFEAIPGNQYFTLVQGGGGPICAEDVDGNGDIGFNDILVVLSEWGPCDGCASDVDGDGLTGFNDILSILSAWGPCE